MSTQHTPSSHHRVQGTEPTRVRLRTDASGRLSVTLPDQSTSTVKVVRCFPWSAPTRLVSLRTDDDEEVAFIHEPSDLDRPSRLALAQALAAAGFILRVRAIHDVTEDFEIRRWQVTTVQGRRTFQTARDAWPRETPTGDFLVEDVAGDLFLFPPPDTLDGRSQALLWALID